MNCFTLDAPTTGEVRLYYEYVYPSYNRGRVEVFLSGEWGTVVGNWTRQNAKVVCQQLGFEVPSKTEQHLFNLFMFVALFIGAAISLRSSYFISSRGIAPVHMSNVQCSGTESNLTVCPHTSGGSGTSATQICYYSYGCK